MCMVAGRGMRRRGKSFVSTGTPMQRWCAKVALPAWRDDCWLWTGSLCEGYGHMQIVKGKIIYAHRFAHEQFVGPIPKGFDVDHLCFNRRCVNPDHLEAVTHRENCIRAKAKWMKQRYGRLAMAG